MTYEIYQTPVSTKYCFRSWDEAGDDFNIYDYITVYCGEIEDNGDKDITETLENLFVKFNINRPSDYYGRSMSISDVVAVKNMDNWLYYYCSNFGWIRIDI